MSESDTPNLDALIDGASEALSEKVDEVYSRTPSLDALMTKFASAEFEGVDVDASQGEILDAMADVFEEGMRNFQMLGALFTELYRSAGEEPTPSTD